MEKIRISVSSYTYDILLKDMDSFEIYKSNGEVNRNEFLNRLIVNYADEYSLMSKHQLKMIEKSIDKHIEMDEYDKINLTNDILGTIREEFSVRNIDEGSVIISLKPTKESSAIIDYIINEQIENQSISSFFRQIFDSYVNMTQNIRERIIFKEQYNALLKSIDKNKQVFITLRSENGKPFTGSLYCVKDNKEEMFNYCLFEVNNEPQTVRLCRIKSVKIINESLQISERTISLFDFQIEYSPAYPISEKDLEVVKIRMDETGVRMYKRTFLYRPKIYKIEGDVYHFKGSHLQIFNYFKRFGRNAIIISPTYLKMKMENYYRDSYFVYKKSKGE
ncbi:MAG: WYL domain-containing protein [Bacilli bacterium]|nr:WYL domain-containing protein [Bacilli bacterium]